jgi:hypothetical protein
MVPRKQAEHMTCTRPQAERQNLLAMRASSTHDPTRTLQSLTDRISFEIRSILMSPKPVQKIGLFRNAADFDRAACALASAHATRRKWR